MRKLIINHFWLALAGLAVIGTAGWVIARSNINEVQVSEIKELIETAETASTVVTAEEVRTLTGSQADLENPAYLSIKDHLTDLDTASDYSNYFYLLGMSGNQVIYLSDSASTESSLHNQPGQVYQDIGGAVRQVFVDGEAVSTSFHNVSLGGGISVLAPIKDLKDGRVLAVFGFNVSQEQWRARISDPQREPILVAFFTSLIYLSFIAYSAWSQKTQIELKQEIEARVESDDARQRQFSENPGVMLLIDPVDGIILNANQSALNFYKYTPETLLKMSFFELNTPPRERIQQEMSSVEKNAGAIFAGSHILADGSLRDVEIKLSLIYIGGRKAMHVNVNDITERKRTEESLRESQSSLQAVMQSTADGLLVVNNENKVTFITDLIELKKAEAEVRESEARFRSLFDDSPISLWEEDFSEVKQRLNDLRAAGVADFDAYLREHPEVVAECVSLVKVLDVNKATLKLYGALTKEDLIKSLSASLPETANEFFRKELVHIAMGFLHFEMEMVAQTLDGRIITVNLNWAAVSGYENDLSKVIVSIIDITEKKQAEDELLDINRQLEELIIRANTFAAEAEMANIAKSEFLANMSHEIRTPMNGVIGMTGLLLDTDLTTEQREYASIIRSSGESLLSVINDILDFSKVEARKLELELLDFDLKDVMKDTVGIFALQVQEKGMQLSLTIEPDVTCLLRGDPGRLRQIIVNLIGNAVKFTPQGAVSVQVKKEAETEKETTLRFLIRDSGIGIPPNRISSLFTPFTQVDSSATRRYGGTGLGLAITKQLAELMNGSVGVESTVGQGSTFWFTAVFGRQMERTFLNNNDGLNFALPKPGIDEAAAVLENKTRDLTQPELTPKNMHLLLVEDNQTNQKVALSILKKLGYSADAVANGIEALETLQKIPYDLVLMDCQMPEMDGFTATAKIRASDSAVLNPRVPVIAMTAHAMKGDRERCLAAGMDDHLAKPIAPAALAEKIAQWLHGSPKVCEIESYPDHQVLTKKTAPPEMQVINSDERNTERVDIFNEADLLKRLMGDRELAKTIVGAFLDEIPHQIDGLKREVANGNSANARILAHTIRGASANLAAEALRQVAHEVEVMAVRGDLDGLTNMIPMIETQFDLFEETIKKSLLLANSLEGVNQ